MLVLTGRVAVVTGAAGSLGRALSLELAAAGMDLSLADIDESGLHALAEQLRALGRRALVVPTDVSELRAVENLLARTLSELGSCHLMCNNAGIFNAAPMLESSEAQWRRVIDTNLWGVIHGCRVFGAHFARQAEGHLLNTASAAGLFPVPGMNAYSTSKYAVVGFSQQLRWELASRGVGVTVLCPGPLRNAMARRPGVGLDHLDIEEMVRRAPTPEDAAKRAVRAIRQNRAQVAIGFEAHVLRVLRLLPSWLIDPLGRLLARKALQAIDSSASPHAL
jgi:short-subunit dehydrogenase